MSNKTDEHINDINKLIDTIIKREPDFGYMHIDYMLHSVMQASRGWANPELVKQCLIERFLL